MGYCTVKSKQVNKHIDWLIARMGEVKPNEDYNIIDHLQLSVANIITDGKSIQIQRIDRILQYSTATITTITRKYSTNWRIA